MKCYLFFLSLGVVGCIMRKKYLSKKNLTVYTLCKDVYRMAFLLLQSTFRFRALLNAWLLCSINIWLRTVPWRLLQQFLRTWLHFKCNFTADLQSVPLCIMQYVYVLTLSQQLKQSYNEHNKRNAANCIIKIRIIIIEL